MQDKPPADQVPADKGMSWPLFFIAGVLIILPTWYVFHYISPIGNLPIAIGSHEIVFKHPDLGEQKHTAMVTLNTPTRLSVDMRKKP